MFCIHECGYVRDDVKPDNILMFPDDNGKLELKIVDFGFPKRMMRNPKYMSTKAIQFGKITHI